MKYLYILTLFLIGISFSAKAQYAMFAEEGTVYYDKTMYTKNILRKQFIEKSPEAQKGFMQNMLPNTPENVVLKKSMKFKGKETLFESLKQELDPNIKQIIQMLALDFEATTYSNLATNEYKRFNDLIGQKVIIQDTLKKVKWTITDEYRDIAGFNCRRANGITEDSTYVIGFYANEIPIDGGPESINGLPGLILGLIVPSQHVSFFATKVEIANNVILDKKAVENPKVKTMSRSEIAKMMNDAFSNFLNKATVDYVIKLALM
ncbi:GLPGLI family protein [Sphingobacterium bovistauri]|uniref:GLPGLI family protein n=1 Tax=Sphingobacterium bovistauri TaxID=2781959 RepID=A0ABS7Z4R2_9SPHI|nr:GLPGLI family protein [Sphingobacterium bovistauri]MCA5004547.1 GLPGLI family protein [Sphingobacterium bovistauri]